MLAGLGLAESVTISLESTGPRNLIALRFE